MRITQDKSTSGKASAEANKAGVARSQEGDQGTTTEPADPPKPGGAAKVKGAEAAEKRISAKGKDRMVPVYVPSSVRQSAETGDKRTPEKMTGQTDVISGPSIVGQSITSEKKKDQTGQATVG